MLRILGSRNVLALSGGQLVSQFGDRLNTLACLAALNAVRPGSTRETTVLWIMIFLPWLFGPIAGVFVDRWNLKRTLVGCDLIRAVLVLAIPLALAFHEFTFWYLYCLVFGINLVSRFFVPARLSVVPRIVETGQLIHANSVLMSAALLGTIIGLAAGDFLVEGLGWELGFWIDAASYLVSGAMLLCLVVRGPEDEARAVAPPAKSVAPGRLASDLIVQLSEGLAAVRRNRLLQFAIFSQALMMFGGGAMVNLVNVMLRTTFADRLAPFGLTLTALGLGAGLGALLLSRGFHRSDRVRVCEVGFLVTSAGVLGFALCFSIGDNLSSLSRFVCVLASAFLTGAAVAPILIACDTLVQEQSDKSLLGRIFAVREAVVAVAMIAGVSVSGLMDFAFPENRPRLLLGIGLFLAVAGVSWSRRARRSPTT